MVERKNKNLVIAIYNHPDYYPPTLNGVEYLSKVFENIYIVHRNIIGLDWYYPKNVHLITHDNPVNVRIAEKSGLFKKIKWFVSFTLKLLVTLRKNSNSVLLFYDYMPILSYRIINNLTSSPKKLWYHNHDVADSLYTKKYSLSWLAWKSENWLFPRLDIFSLPSLDRKEYFPMNTLKGSFYYLPNFPSKFIFQKFYNYEIPKIINDKLTLLFHGSIGPYHGIEEIIDILEYKINGLFLEIVLKGFISQEYSSELKKLAKIKNVEKQLIILPPSGLKGVIQNMQYCHVGIGIYKKEDIMNKTVATASNKIYEYAAAGMPVLLFDTEQFRVILGKRKWAIFTDTSSNSIKESLSKIIDNYTLLSNNAMQDFKDKFCFENNFQNVVEKIQ